MYNSNVENPWKRNFRHSENSTWGIAKLPKGKKINWMSISVQVKINIDGIVESYNMQVVSKGFT